MRGKQQTLSILAVPHQLFGPYSEEETYKDLELPNLATGHLISKEGEQDNLEDTLSTNDLSICLTLESKLSGTESIKDQF